MTIASRLLVALGALVIIISALSGFACFSAIGTRDLVATMMRLKNNQVQDQQFEKHLLDARAIVWIVLATDDQSIMPRATAAFQAARERLDELKAQSHTQRHLDAITGLRARVDDYAEALMQLVALHGANQAVVAPDGRRLIRAVQDTTARIREVIEPLSKDYSDEAEALAAVASTRLQRMVTTAMAAGAGSVLLGLALSFLVSRSIVGPINALTGAMLSLAKGDLDITIPERGQRNETGRMAAALVVFRDQALENRRLVAEQANEQEAAQQAKRRALMDMAETIEREAGLAVEQVSALTGEMSATAEAMGDTAARTGQNAAEAAAAAAQTLGTAQTVASAADQLAATIAEITRNVGTSSLETKRTVAAAESARAGIESLSQRADEIGTVAGTIAGIAGRTNMLALNATIEAARAGEAGRGFAVVAGEVKLLAKQTAAATGDIGGQIAAIQEATGGAVSAFHAIAATIADVERLSTSVAASVEEQAAATAEIARSVSETARAADRVSQCTDDVRGAARETHLQAGSVRETALTLEAAVQGLRKTVIRVVRTSTSEINRRMDPRIPVDLAATLTLSGQPPLPVRVADLSIGGALLQGVDHFAPGQPARLAVEGLDLPVKCRAIHEKGRVGVSVEADAAGRERLWMLLARLAPAEEAA
jgi:methyl-accepting chemotaxis protein